MSLFTDQFAVERLGPECALIPAERGGMSAGLTVMELFGAIAGNRAFGNESMLISLVPALLIGGWCMWRLVSETWPKEYVPRRPQTVDSPMSSD